MKKKLNN